VDDVNDMNDSPDIVEQALRSSMKRRDFLTKAAAAGAITWATPVILSRAAYAVEGGEGTPNCRPTVKVCCTRYFCNQGSKYFPGVALAVSNCPCSSATCSTACVKIVNITNTGGFSIAAYGPGTTCGPLSGGGTDVGNVFSDGNWHCLTTSMSTIFFGKVRGGNGAIGDIGSASVSFDLAVWASCPDRTPGNGPASTCTTHRYTVMLGTGNTPVCHCDNPTGPAASLCDGTGFSPCPSGCAAESTCTATPACPTSTGTPADPSPIQSTPIACPS
jgi:hypothetical protein